MSKENLNKEPQVKITKNGPYIISGRIPLTDQIIIVNEDGIPVEWRTGKKYPTQEKCGLCRCGNSKNKPYCDGTHIKIDFDGTETANTRPYIELAKVMDGPELKLTDLEDLCASARFCHRAGEIWTLIPKSNQPEARKIAIEEACNCPSGRLVVWDKKTNKPIEPNFEKAIGLIEDPQLACSGPIWVQGGIQITSTDGLPYEVRNRVTLCRCGKSTIKPFCDSSHFPEHQYKELMAQKKNK